MVGGLEDNKVRGTRDVAQTVVISVRKGTETKSLYEDEEITKTKTKTKTETKRD